METSDDQARRQCINDLFLALKIGNIVQAISCFALDSRLVVVDSFNKEEIDQSRLKNYLERHGSDLRGSYLSSITKTSEGVYEVFFPLPSSQILWKVDFPKEGNTISCLTVTGESLVISIPKFFFINLFCLGR